MGERMGSAQARELGEELRIYRELAEISGQELAQRLGWSASKLSRVETGDTGITELDVVRYAAHCDVPAKGIDALLGMCRDPGLHGYWLTPRLSSLIFHENKAAFSSSYDNRVVPGLLQTQEYATALLCGQWVEPALAQYWVEARMERQRLLHRRGFEFFIHEQALRLPVGGNRVMNEQLLKLVLISEERNVSIRVLPIALGAQTASCSEFVLFRYSGHHQPLVYIDPVGLFLEDRSWISRYHEMLARISEVALGRGESRELLATLASEFDQPEDSPDAPDHLAEEQLQR